MDGSSEREAFATGGSNRMTSGLTEVQRIQALDRFAVIRLAARTSSSRDFLSVPK